MVRCSIGCRDYLDCRCGWAYCFEDQVLARGEGATVTSSANDFASKMKDVSLSIPKSIVISEIKDAYSPFISKSL